MCGCASAFHAAPARRENRGFTLLELLIAVAVFAIMAVMAYGGLSNVIVNSEQTQQAMIRLQQVQLAMLNLSRDIRQLSRRSIRDEYGNSINYIMTAEDQDIFIEFSRGGRRNPAELLRSHLQRVAYRLEDNALIRMDWKELDRGQQSEAHEKVLLEDVESVELRFLGSNNEWSPEWPPLRQTGPAETRLIAIELRLVLQDWGALVRLFRVAA